MSSQKPKQQDSTSTSSDESDSDTSLREEFRDLSTKDESPKNSNKLEKFRRNYQKNPNISVDEVPGIGRKTKKLLERVGISTALQLHKQRKLCQDNKDFFCEFLVRVTGAYISNAEKAFHAFDDLTSPEENLEKKP